MHRCGPVPALLLTLASCYGGDPAVDATTGTTGNPATTTTATTGTTAPTTPTSSGVVDPASSGDGLTGTSDATDSTGGADPLTGSTGDTTTTSDGTTTDATTGDDTSGDDSTTDAAPPDPCVGVTPSCPDDPPQSGGGGLEEIDRCAYPLHDADTWATQGGRVDALAAVLPTQALAALPLAQFNRDAVQITSVPGGVKNISQAFRWNAEDDDLTTWVPQGLTGTADASPDGKVGGRRLVLVSWYHETKGVRVSVVDIADPKKPVYRHILLVEPIAGDPVNFKPILIHAGGMAWVGDYLYVVHTGAGFRVFDTRKLMQVNTDADTIGWDAGAKVYRGGLYKFILPQVGAYLDKSPCNPLFSSVTLDRTSDPPSLVSSEYCNGTDACAEQYSGRLFRWPLDLASGKLMGPDLWPDHAYYMGQSHIQGSLAADGDFYLSSSRPAGAAGELYHLPGGGKSVTRTWVDTPEDLMRDGKLIWSLSEGTGKRVVFAVPLAGL